MGHFEYTWWKEAVGYQIYPKSFYDGNGDGHGDLVGIIEKLPYLHELGIDFLWICPFFKSPMDDNGYDVSDYREVNACFGTTADAIALIDEARKYDIKIIVDLVLNHTSDEHPWFVDVRNNKDSKYRDYYIIRDCCPEGKEPNNWGSFFGGSAWEKLNDEEYYLKIFSKKMPDLNWANPELRKELYDIASWWMDVGVDGFRIDAIAHIAKDDSFENSTKQDELPFVSDWSKFSNLKEVHHYLREFHDQVLKPHNAFAIGEVGGKAKVEDVLQYCGYDNDELDVTFTFDHVWCNNIDEAQTIDELKTDVLYLKETLEHWQVSLFGKAWYPLYWNNHDFNRLVSNYGSYKYHRQSATALATLMYCMWGTPFIYQGEEIGMTNYPFTSIEEFDDVQAIGQYYAKPEKERAKFLKELILSSRDNVRTVMQWDDTSNAGFSTSDKIVSLLNPNYKKINVKNQIDDSSSILNYYKKLIQLKKTNHTFIYGTITFEDVIQDQAIAYYRYDKESCYYVIVNLDERDIEVTLPAFEEVFLTNADYNSKDEKITLHAYDTYVLKLKMNIE